MNHRYKDLSKIPDILNSSEQGLVLLQVEEAYKNITPLPKRVTRNYLYRFLAFAKQKGIVKDNGTNKTMRISDRGPYPKRIVLTNKNISEEEWDQLIQDYRTHYTGKKATKSKRKIKKVSVGKLSSKIIESFEENRNNPNKRFVESHFLTIIRQYLCHQKVNCLTVTGPDYNRHMKSLFSTIADKVYVVENKKEVFKTIFNKAIICPNYINGNVRLVNSDIEDVIIHNCRYVDVDLMCSIQNISKIVIGQVNNQSLFFSNDELKFISFTSSERGDGGIHGRIGSLKNILLSAFDCELLGFQAINGNTIGIDMGPKKRTQLSMCQKHLHLIKRHGRVVDLQVMSYQDTTPMLSVLIVYK